MAKALSALAALTSISTRAYKSPLIIMKTSPSAGLIMAKALDALRGDRLNADQRGRLMLAVANVDPTPIRQAGRNAIAQLGAVERQLAAGATASHLEAATVLVRSAQAILASGKMTAGDHAALSLALNMLREKIEGGVHAR
jgi:hypothetical protein